MFRTLKWLLLAAIAGAVLLAALAAWWLQRPLPLAPQAQGVVDVVIEPGTSARGVARVLVQSGLQTSPDLLFLWFRASGQAHRLQAGTYEFGPDTSPRELLRKLVAGEQALRRRPALVSGGDQIGARVVVFDIGALAQHPGEELSGRVRLFGAG